MNDNLLLINAGVFSLSQDWEHASELMMEGNEFAFLRKRNGLSFVKEEKKGWERCPIKKDDREEEEEEGKLTVLPFSILQSLPL